MLGQLSFIAKVLVLSAAIAMVIKYIAPRLAIATNAANALIAVVTPSLCLAVALVWQSQRVARASEPD